VAEGVKGNVLHDDSQLYVLLVAYTDFGGCRHMMSAAGAVPTRLRAVEALLDNACRGLDRAATLFTQAASHDDVRALRAARRSVVRSSVALARAQIRLRVDLAKP